MALSAAARLDPGGHGPLEVSLFPAREVQVADGVCSREADDGERLFPDVSALVPRHEEDLEVNERHRGERKDVKEPRVDSRQDPAHPAAGLHQPDDPVPTGGPGRAPSHELDAAEDGGEAAERPDEPDHLPGDPGRDLGGVFERVEDGHVLVDACLKEDK